MYIVASKRKSGGTTYTYYNLVEGVRTPKGPRHRVILSLGKLENIPPERIKLLGRLVDQRLSAHRRLLPPEADEQSLQQEAERIARQVLQLRAEEPGEEAVENVHLDSVAASEAVLLGPIHVGIEMWKRLGLEKTLERCGFSARHRKLAMIEVVSRLVNPASELATSRWVEHTAFGDLLEEKLQYVNKDALYRVSDRLWAARTAIETALGEREQELFDLGSTMVLYDLTSTYFEGTAAGNEKAARGYSRDHRGDCLQVVLGMVLDEAGFPKASEIWKGNTHDSTTMEAMLEQLEQRRGTGEDATVVMDRGIATAENLEKLRERGYHYIVGLASASRWKWVKRIRSAEFSQLDAEHPEIAVSRVEDDDEVFLLVRSESRREKDQAIRTRFTKKLADELTALAAQVTAGKVDAEKAQVRIGRLRQKYQRASRFLRTEFRTVDEQPQLLVEIDEEKRRDAEVLDGVYILKTDRRELDTDQLWRVYITLERVERSFRYLKGSLGLRPVYHQLTDRADGHIFISILAYHLLHTIEHLCRAHGDTRSWPTLNAELETHRCLTVSLTGTDGYRHHLRLATTPTEAQKGIYTKLNVGRKPLQTRRYTANPTSSDETTNPNVLP